MTSNYPCKTCTNLFITGHNEVVAKVIFLHLSIIHSVHSGVLPQCMLGYHPPRAEPPGADPQSGSLLEQTPPGADPPRADTPTPPPPRKQTPAYGLRAAGTHPTGMHSCCRGKEMATRTYVIKPVVLGK